MTRITQITGMQKIIYEDFRSSIIGAALTSRDGLERRH
jgi:hypothetical protein